MHKPKAYLLLGRFGDVCNLLPVVEYESAANNYKPKFFISKDFAPLLEGCSYIEPMIWKENFWNYEPALNWASQSLDGFELINCSLAGRGYLLIKKCRSFVREGWRLAKCPVPWGHLPLTFNNRSPEREKALLEKYKIPDKPFVAITTKGNSSPFEQMIDLSAYLKNVITEMPVVDLSNIKAERFYDMLAVLERAHSFITIDSGLLHLAHAVEGLPIISMVGSAKDNNWLQSDWRPNHILRIEYDEVIPNIELITRAVLEGFDFTQQKINFITSGDYSDLAAKRRCDFAKYTRELEGNYSKRFNFMEFPVELIEKRNSMMFGDCQKLPFIKDMIDYACGQNDIKDYDMVMICNSDICFTPGITGWLLHDVERHDAVYFYRMDFNPAYMNKPLVNEEQVSKGTFYVGSDAFAFTKEWWIKNRDLYPDMLFGREGWDTVMRNLVRRSGGVEIPLAIYHELHPQKWASPLIRTNGATDHNVTIAKRWFNTYGGDWNDWRFDAQQLKVRFK